MTHIAPFVADRFSSTIPHYVAGRPAYGAAMLERLARETGLGPHARVLDLGCGPGSVALPLAGYCGTLIAIDPDRAMIAAGREAAERAGIDIDWRVGSSFDLTDDLAPLDLVTMGRSFHWMDREATLQRLDALIKPDGAVALLNTELHAVGGGSWLTAFEELRKAHGRFDTFYHLRKSEAWESHISVLLRSAFNQVERLSTFEARTTSLDEIVARALSFSANSPASLGEGARDDYEQAVRERLTALEPTGVFPEIVESVAIIARRPG